MPVGRKTGGINEGVPVPDHPLLGPDPEPELPPPADAPWAQGKTLPRQAPGVRVYPMFKDVPEAAVSALQQVADTAVGLERKRIAALLRKMIDELEAT